MGGRGGAGELGLCFLSHPRHLLSLTFRRMHGPQGTDWHICTVAALTKKLLHNAAKTILYQNQALPHHNTTSFKQKVGLSIQIRMIV